MSSLELQARKAYQTGARWLAAAAIFTGVSAAGVLAYNGWQNRSPEAIKARVVAVSAGNIENTINAGGTVELAGQRTIKSPDESAVDQVLVKVGDRITVNQPLITLRNPERDTILSKAQLDIQKQEILVERDRQKVTEAEDHLAFIQADYESDLKAYRAELQSKAKIQDLEIQQQQAQVERNRQKVEEARENLVAAELELENQQKLLERGFIAGKEVESQAQTVRQSRASLRDAEYTFKESQIQLETKKTELIAMDQPVDSSKVMEAENQLRQAQSDLQQSTRELKKLKVAYQEEGLKLQNNIVAAPLSGIVLSIKVQPGDGVNLGDDLITLGDPSQELVKLQLSTLNAVQVRPGQPARVSVIGPDAESFAGQINQIELQAGGNNADQQSGDSSEPAAVPATVELDQPTGTLIPGSSVSVEIILDQRQNVVALDTELVQRDGKAAYVWIVDGASQARKQPITLGLEGLLQVEITSGLKPKDQVIEPPADLELQEGMAITAEAKEQSENSLVNP
ncbi:MAG: efflux RND transporter periplasmic adaptor subunit [Oscillatoriales cyanobacterium RM2_1_1]|nr:efflux RND transporter periplasmic adaptor subunit [Oscillatoriales cyanobacterium SM2_3_0]NJO46498.1 efflux RND transporter periplasmic adaptor subunit [Oscillatoriales cyanobacterium RM2_1_1]